MKYKELKEELKRLEDEQFEAVLSGRLVRIRLNNHCVQSDRQRLFSLY